MKLMSKKGISFIELIVALLILALTLAGLVNLFISGKRWALLSQTKMTGGELGKLFLDDYHVLVRQNDWGLASNCLSQGFCSAETAGIAEGMDREYVGTYTINNNTPAIGLHRVKVDITWNVSANVE